MSEREQDDAAAGTSPEKAPDEGLIDSRLIDDRSDSGAQHSSCAAQHAVAQCCTAGAGVLVLRLGGGDWIWVRGGGFLP